MNKIRLVILTAGMLFINLMAFAQQFGTIKGKVTTADGKAASFISIGLKGSNSGNTTDEKGFYTLHRVKPGSYTIVASAVGIKPAQQSVILAAGESKEINFSLTETDQALEEVTIAGKNNRYKTSLPSASLRLNEPLLEAPQNIQVVTNQVLKDQQIISMSDGLIRNVSGAVRMEHWGDMYTNITMRGSQIQAMRNGFNVVSSYWGPLTEDMSFVDHIEFVKGPAGFMLSNGDPSGMYNVVTKKPTGFNKGEVSFTAGSYDLYRTAVDFDRKLTDDGKLLFRLNAAVQNKGSFRPYEQNDRYSFAPVLSYQITSKTKLTAEYTLQSARMTEVGSYYVFAPGGYAQFPRELTMTQPGLPATRMKDHSLFLNLQHNFNSNWKLTAQAAYFKYLQTGYSSWPSAVNANNTVIRNVGIWDAESSMKLAQLFINGQVKTGGINHRILAGFDGGKKNYMADWGQSHDLDLASSPFDLNNPNYGYPSNGYPDFDRTTPLAQRAVKAGGLMSSKYLSGYLQDELGFFNNVVRLTLAGRYTYVNQSAWGGAPDKAKHFTPRVGLSVSVDKNTSVYAVYDEAFTPQSGLLRNNAKVEPITGTNNEIGIKKDWFDGKWNTTLSVYRINKNNELTTDPTNGFIPNPADPTSPIKENYSVVLGKKRAQGVEFDLRGKITDGLTLIANYAYTDAKVTEVAAGVTGINVGDVIPGFAKHVSNAWLTYTIQKGILKGSGISGGFTYLVDRATDNWGVGLQKLPNYFKLDGGLFYEHTKFKITGNVFNVLNKYLYSGSYYSFLNAYYTQAEAPRNYRVSVAYKF
ncbi:TonB-dependent receptor [Pedobacter nototheniae]|uniref:TonB-dependent receptor n=1 Tax=Pedobacter nototheniae TaxID=2488994 RepID=UPI0029312087|nr:TonB-dependent receptor [Pedobacter nototheniae]